MMDWSRLLAFAQEDSGAAEPFRPAVPPGSDFWQPAAASSFAEDVDWLYSALYWVSVMAFLAVVGVAAIFVIRYRAKSRTDSAVGTATASHHTGLEITWSIPPLVIMMAFFVWGFKDFVDMKTPPEDALEIRATARKWNWEFTYQNGESDSKLHVPIGRDVRILIQSMDVVHSLYIPAFRVKMDAVPGRYTDLWFRATERGKYPIFCTEYCGTSHSDMLSEVTVESQAEFIDYLDNLGGGYETPVALGEAMYERKGCAACHSLDGTRKVGPSWKGIFGTEHKLADGSTITVDENYIRESILEPNAKIVEGYTPSMPTYKGQLDEEKVNGLVEYIKSLK